jgi:hypothetical protein
MARWRDRLLTIFGDIKVFRWPMWMVYDPGSYRVKGRDARALIELARPGDVLVRGFDSYLDGKFIPGYFSHAGLYLGPTSEADLAAVRPQAYRLFRTGAQTVIHSVAEGVTMEDLLDFSRCDRLVVLRFPEVLRATPGAVSDDPGPLDPEERTLRDRLAAGGEVSWREAWPVVRRIALAQLGRGYDFEFDFTDVRRLSCTEFVHRATRSLAPFLGIQPTPQKILFLRGVGIAPDAFVSSPLELGWASPSTKARRLEALRARALRRGRAGAAAA